MNLEIEVVEKGEKYLIRLNGEIDVYTAPKLQQHLLPIANKHNVMIQVDLLHTSYIDSTGLGVFINAYKETQKNNGELELIHVHDRVLRLLQVTGLDRIMNVHVSEMDRGNNDE